MQIDQRTVIYGWHVFVVAPLLFYLGYNRGNIPESAQWIWILLMLLAVTVWVYHGKKLYDKTMDGKGADEYP